MASKRACFMFRANLTFLSRAGGESSPPLPHPPGYAPEYIDFRVFLSIECLNLDKTAFALFNLIAISEICCF